MCFSATASFSVGASLTLLGSLTIRTASASVNARKQLPFAAIPLLFGVQQLVEGSLWLSLEHQFAWLQTLTTYLFTFFSHILWPAFVPFAVAMLEKGGTGAIPPWRWRMLWALRITGIVVAFMLAGLVATEPLTAVAGSHIVYVTPFFYDWPMMVLYIAATCLSALISSQRMVRLFGALVFVFFFVSYWFYTEAFFSVWCFFAAILSAVIYLHVRAVGRGSSSANKNIREG